ncbi:SdpA family antimicrobial peptide system protein [Streptomyces sp. TRM 70361]|uniref:SdpA family antimicrobial peptide system protein n=1 Tax=Streptomyces sp. TRM 70361 TaxID=3116553 RepID=UPI002E7B645E|nr:SdpA family antimicrobial peptide system protein [Streptomyces sp. TRM 70361]MEE1942655.1 SdpA family antimicrobial peptide system protein [Streptomyces sp. TRM 70361]
MVPRPWITAVTAVWVVLSLYVAQSFLPRNAVSLPAQDAARKAAATVAPQGWAFFTKSAKSRQHVPYRLVDGEWKNISRAPHSRPANFFGFDRAPRSQGIEVALMLHQRSTEWTGCETTATVDACLARGAKRATEATNPSPAPGLCGRAAVVEMRPTPWAWRHLTTERHTAERVAVWDVRCP